MSMGSQRVRHNWATEQKQFYLHIFTLPFVLILNLRIIYQVWINFKDLISYLTCQDICLCYVYNLFVLSFSVQFSSVAQSYLTLRPHESQHARPLCPSPTPRAYSNSCALSHWCHPTISSSIVPFSSCPQSFPASGSFPMSQLFASGGQSIGT